MSEYNDIYDVIDIIDIDDIDDEMFDYLEDIDLEDENERA